MSSRPSEFVKAGQESTVRPGGKFQFTGCVTFPEFESHRSHFERVYSNLSSARKSEVDALISKVVNHYATLAFSRREEADIGHVLAFLRDTYYFVDEFFLYQVFYPDREHCAMCGFQVHQRSRYYYHNHFNGGACPIRVLSKRSGVYQGSNDRANEFFEV